MPQKIKIVSLLKTQEYLQKELDAVQAFKYKLLRDSDWTQTLDAPISAVDVLRWRHWRWKVRESNVTLELLSSAKAALESLECSRPEKHIGQSAVILSRFNYTSVDAFKLSCTEVIKELLPRKSLYLKTFNSLCKASAPEYDAVFANLLGVIKNGY